MEIFTILYVLTLNYIATEAYERVERAANCPKFTEGDITGLKIKYRRQGTKASFRCRKKSRYGPKFATCQLDGTWSNEPPLCTKPGCVPLDPSQVTNLDMEVVNGAVVKFSCLNHYLLIGDTLAYCNGKNWSAPLPRCAAPNELTECDFEDDLCGWKQDDDEEQDWILNVGATQTGNTGPKHDHTLGDTGNGHYLYFETSHPTTTGHQANLLSPMYTEDLSPMCFDFWYHILGPDVKGHVGSLEVFVLDQSQYIDDDDVKPLFYIDGNQGDQWHRGNIFIEKQDEPFQISIVATRALSNISDIAIDDVRLHNCTKNTTSPPVTSSSSSSTTTTSSTTSTSGTTTTTTTVTTKITETSSPTTVVIETTTTTKTPTETTIKKETTTTQSPETTVANTSKSETNKPVTTTTESTTVVKTSSLPHTSQAAISSTKADSSPKVTMERQTSQSTPKPSFTETTMGNTRTMQPEIKTTRQATTQSTKKVQTPDTAGTLTTVSSSTTSSSTASTSSSTKSPITSTTVTSSTTSEKSSTPQPTQEQGVTITKAEVTNTDTGGKTSKSAKSTKRTNEITTKSPDKPKGDNDNSITASESRSQHPEDDTLKPLMIGLGVGIVSGLIIIGVIAYVCVRRRKFYTSRHEDELKPKTNSASLQSLNNTSRLEDELKPKTNSASLQSLNNTSRHEDELKPKTNSASLQSLNNTSRHEDELKPKTDSASLQSLNNTSRHEDELKPKTNSASLQSLNNTSRHEDELKPKTNSASLQSLNNEDEEHESES
ncbi:mucin-5AC-like isoform X2 [Ruditapes philippinarum]|uniref:mucin-5AC-like isoform X2 n=1 Tax=Ruditapes philippinarum TaxID=129788 RepID=UPI00295B5ECD|nr:mucin-5AC-like isoform X2 [Ruditapes philippinarum]